MRSAFVLLLAALACGKPGRAPAVRAFREAGHIEARWQGEALRIATAGFDLREELDAAPASAGAARLPDDARADAVWLTRPDGAREVGFVSSGAEGGNGAPWQIFAPEDFRGGELHVVFPALPAGERLGILFVNEGARDGAQVAVTADGLPAAAVAEAPSGQLRGALTMGTRPADAHETVRALQEAQPTGTAAAPEMVASEEHRAFCVVRALDFGHRVRKPATRVATTAFADFYVDDEDLSHYGADFFPALAGAFEEKVRPAVWSAFGAPTDVDQNGKVEVLLTHELGASLNGGWLIGYFGNNDLLHSRDGSDGCGDSGSNHGEIVYLNDVANAAANGYGAAEVAASVYPATLAHELQHLINLGRRCVERSCDGPEETWINEALSKVAEDLAGFGWNAAQGRSEGARYLTRASGQLRGYDARSLTLWEGDPIGNYQGAHSFLRFFSDKLGPGLARTLVADGGGVGALEQALQRPLPRAMAEWATALLLSNEQGTSFSYSGAEWSPFHQRLRHLDYVPLSGAASTSLRTDGLAAFVTAAGPGGAAGIRVRSSEQRPPHVVVVRIAGDLPR